MAPLSLMESAVAAFELHEGVEAVYRAEAARLWRAIYALGARWRRRSLHRRPGHPTVRPRRAQIYFVGLLAGENDHKAVERTGDGRAINRHDYSRREVEEAVRRPVVRRLLELVRLRNTHPAFEGALAVESDGEHSLWIRWRNGDETCSLEVDLTSGRTAVTDGRGAALVTEPI
jgi:hypothetical protein